MHEKNYRNVFIGTSTFDSLTKKKITLLRNNGIIIKLNPKKRKLSKKELTKFAKDSEIIIAGTEIYDKEVLLKLNKLKFLFRLGSGDENIDHLILKTKKVKYRKSKITPFKAVAELIVGMILILYRNIINHHNHLIKKKWEKNMGNLLFGKTIGIIGFGKVGKYLSHLIKNFGVKVLIYDPLKITRNQSRLTYVLKKSDIISLCASYNGGPPILNKKNLNLIRRNSILINTSRPEHLDHNHLIKLLKNNKIAGVGLDVFEKEPYDGDFVKEKNIILTPHVGSYALEIRKEMENEALQTILKYLNGNKKYNI